MKTIYTSISRSANYLKLFLLVSFFTLVFGVQRASATHAAGAELTYHCTGGNTYIVTYTFYRDCFGISAPTSVTLNYSSVTCAQNLSLTLNPVGAGVEITHPCSTTTTTCSGGTQTGIQRWVYEGTITLPSQCTDWILGVAVSARNAAITTLMNPGTFDLYVEAHLNNSSVACNNSPMFATEPILFLCAGQTMNYNLGAIDADGDSLAYSPIAPLGMIYNPPFSPDSPFTSVPAIVWDSINGNIIMNPTVVGQVAIVVVLVEEYRNGVLIGSVERDLQVYIVACTNNLPTATGINGTTNHALTVCAGSPINFTINSADIDAAQSDTMMWNSGISGATFTTTAGTRPVGTFSWTPTLADVRSQPYTFTVTVRDDACPTNGAQVYSFSITVGGFSVTTSSTNVKCNGDHDGTATAVVNGASGTYQYLWSPGGHSGQTITGLGAGTYTCIVSGNGCTASAVTTITEPTQIFMTMVQVNASCISGTGSATFTVTGGTPPYQYSLNSHPTQASSTVTNLAPGFYIQTVRDANGCRKSMPFIIMPPNLPLITFNWTAEFCSAVNGSANALVTGGIPPYTYSWIPFGGSASLATGLTASTYTVVVTDANGCTGTGSVVIPNVTTPPLQPSPIAGLASVCANQTGVGYSVSYDYEVQTYAWTVPPGATITSGQGTDSITVTFGSSAGNVNVFATNCAGTSPTTTLAVAMPCRMTGKSINDTFENFSVYPNPSDDVLNITIKGTANENVKVEMHDILGKVVYFSSEKSGMDYLGTVDIRHFPSGIYMLRVTYLNEVRTVKVVKE